MFVCVQSVKSMSHPECMSRLGRRVAALVVMIAGALAATPGAAAAHGPVAPVASSYLARVGTLPAGLDAKVIDGWHDGRLHALATVALAPGVSYVGRWSIPLLVDGRPSAVSGGVWHAGDPSIVWFWPIVVLLACVLAVIRVRRPALDLALARAIAIAALGAIAAAGIGLELQGRPVVSVFQLVQLAVIVGFVGWGLHAVLIRRSGWFAMFRIAWAALWAGFELLPTLLNGFVLIALPAFVARASAVLCLGCGAGLLVLVSRLSARRGAPPALEAVDDSVAV